MPIRPSIETKKLQLRRELDFAQNTLDIIIKFSGTANQRPTSDLYAPHIIRATNAVKAIQQQLDSIERSTQGIIRSKEFAKEFASQRNTETKEDKKKRLSETIGTGGIANANQRKQYGGWKGLADAVYAYVIETSRHGIRKVVGADIAHQFNTTARTANKWLERPEFTKTARLLGRR